jgi:hypothetical protein
MPEVRQKEYAPGFRRQAPKDDLTILRHERKSDYNSHGAKASAHNAHGLLEKAFILILDDAADPVDQVPGSKQEEKHGHCRKNSGDHDYLFF